jgi:uncharacterized damage-inducible protein DinB
MDVRDVLRASIGRAKMITDMLLGDLSDADLLVRPVPGANHVAWQLGHVIVSLNYFGETIKPGSMPALPAQFAEQHSKETAASDQPADFWSKQEYASLLDSQRQAFVDLLARVPVSRLDEAAPEKMRDYAPRISDLVTLVAEHEMMHSGQFSVVRRKLGKPVIF